MELSCQTPFKCHGLTVDQLIPLAADDCYLVALYSALAAALALFAALTEALYVLVACFLAALKSALACLLAACFPALLGRDSFAATSAR